MSTEHWIVGAEYEAALFDRLGESPRSLGYRISGQRSGVAGSQKIREWDAICAEGIVTIEAETYVGLSVMGPSNLVAALKQHFSLGTDSP